MDSLLQSTSLIFRKPFSKVLYGAKESDLRIKTIFSRENGKKTGYQPLPMRRLKGPEKEANILDFISFTVLKGTNFQSV
jgi:hypothetical protein